MSLSPKILDISLDSLLNQHAHILEYILISLTGRMHNSKIQEFKAEWLMALYKNSLGYAFITRI